MGFCGFIFRSSGYTIIVLIAILVYFHIECMNEEQEDAKFTDKFDPKVTDAVAKLTFAKKDTTNKIHLGLGFMFSQWAPCPVKKFVNFLSPAGFKLENGENKTIDILDARKKSPGPFDKTGFTLITLDKESVTKDWRTQLQNDPNADVKHFTKEMEPHIRKLYPNVKRIEWTHNVIRGGNKPGDQPPALISHLDYHQDKDLRVEFHKNRPALPEWLTRLTNKTESNYLMGLFDTENEKFKVMLGVWKPISPEKVCDKPLAVMDARTFKPEFQTRSELSMNLLAFTFNNLGGGIAYSPEQKWYYYSFQSTKEVLVFHQYTEGKFFANPHTSFLNKNCPKDTQSRQSVELRVALFF